MSTTSIHIKNIPEGYQSIIHNNKHTVIGDEPVSSKGTDLGFSPSDFLLSAIALCKAATIRYTARKNGWQLDNVEAHLSMDEHRVEGVLTSTVNVSMQIFGDLTDLQVKELLRQADRCYTHRQLEGNWNILPITLIELNPTHLPK